MKIFITILIKMNTDNNLIFYDWMDMVIFGKNQPAFEFIKKHPKFSDIISDNLFYDLNIKVLREILPLIYVKDLYNGIPIWKHFINFIFRSSKLKNIIYDIRLGEYESKNIHNLSKYPKEIDLYIPLIDKMLLNKELSNEILIYILELENNYNLWIFLFLYYKYKLLSFMFSNIKELYENYRYIVGEFENISPDEDNLEENYDYDTLICYLDSMIVNKNISVRGGKIIIN